MDDPPYPRGFVQHLKPLTKHATYSIARGLQIRIDVLRNMQEANIQANFAEESEKKAAMMGHCSIFLSLSRTQ